MKEYNPLNILCQNGWKWHYHPNDKIMQLKGFNSMNDDYDLYTMSFLGNYKTKILACVSAHEKHLCNDGHYGVLWLEVVKYECKRPYCYSDLEDMMYALELAEDNLLRIGMPFVPDYDFHGEKAKDKAEVNKALRIMYDLDAKERKAGYGDSV